MFAEINYWRANESFIKYDDYGNHAGTYYAPQLTWDNILAGQARTFAMGLAAARVTETYDYMGYIIQKAYSNFNTPKEAARALTTDSSNYVAGACYRNAELTKAGTVCFTYDRDGTGLKMDTIWVIYYGE